MYVIYPQPAHCAVSRKFRVGTNVCTYVQVNCVGVCDI